MRAHQVQIVLHNISLERLNGKTAVAHRHDERVVDEAAPDFLDFRSREEILDEVAPNLCQSGIAGGGVSGTNGEKGKL